MSTLPEVRGAPPAASAVGETDQPGLPGTVIQAVDVPAVEPAPGSADGRRGPAGADRGGSGSGAGTPGGRWRSVIHALARLDATWQFPLVVYLASRVVYFVIALVDAVASDGPLSSAIAHWDGKWYVSIALLGYPSGPHINAAYWESHWTRFGFLPLYPMVMWAARAVTGLPAVYAGLLVSLLTGLTATLLIARLAQRWWGDQRLTRRAILFFVIFPGSIVFSMDYSEGLMLTLVAGSLLALEDRRWLLAGVLAGLSTAVGPVADAIIPACAVVALVEVRRLRRSGSSLRAQLRPLIAPLLSPGGLIAFGAYLWVHVGTPLASYQAQKHAWHESSDPLALVFQGAHLVQEIFLKSDPARHIGTDLNIVVGLLGAVFLVWGLRYLWRDRRVISLGAIVWTLGVALLTVTSDQVPPNPRMLLCAFPILLVLAVRLGRIGYRRLLGWGAGAMVLLSALTYIYSLTRP
jgi:hypothetical protein